MKNKKKFIVIGVVLALAMSVFAAWAFANGEMLTTYYACINNSSGTIKVWTEPKDCSTNEFPIQWSAGPPEPPPAIEAFATGNGGIDLLLNDEKDMMVLDLPAGKFISNVTLSAAHDGTGSSFLSCRYDYIDSGGRYTLSGQAWQSGLFAGTVPSALVSHAHTHAITLDEPTQVIVVCEVNFQDPQGPTVEVNHLEWNVIKVDILNIQPDE